MHPGVTVENSKGQKDELIVQGKGTFRYYVNAQTGEVSCVFTTIFDSWDIQVMGGLIWAEVNFISMEKGGEGRGGSI